MNTKIQFQKGASVLTSNGIQVGTVERVVVNPGTNVLTDIVVRTGGLLKKDEKVVPVRLITDTTEDVVLLRDDVADLEALPPFEEERLVESTDNTNATPTAVEQQPIIGGSPVMGTPVLVALSDDQPVTRIEKNIPEGTIAVKEGAKVVTAEGERVGTVERVLADPSEEQVTHLLISRGLLVKHTKLIPIMWVRSLGEEKVQLRVKRDLVEKLADASSLAV